MLDETQLRPADEKGGANNGRNIVRPQTQEPYGDQELAAESKVHFERHFAGQPLETKADRDANDQLRREQYERAQVDPVFRHQQKIDMPDEDKLVRMREVAVPLLYGDVDLPVDGEDDLTDEEINEAEQAFEHELDDAAEDEKEAE